MLLLLLFLSVLDDGSGFVDGVVDGDRWVLLLSSLDEEAASVACRCSDSMRFCQAVRMSVVFRWSARA